ncbi:Uu.00g040840.m01.CDS01 [Anthostomella pinea]|uniref:Uu.00g040840.m01.CDS01 n=1 Tax=Anthostomella pinea TaxID=933095 RepID=A0AAI8VAA1_9PEZI|nr:Uu.00g040840.m01.CDS01 [Anthostomella pinea]
MTIRFLCTTTADITPSPAPLSLSKIFTAEIEPSKATTEVPPPPARTAVTKRKEVVTPASHQQTAFGNNSRKARLIREHLGPMASETKPLSKSPSKPVSKPLSEPVRG